MITDSEASCSWKNQFEKESYLGSALEHAIGLEGISPMMDKSCAMMELAQFRKKKSRENLATKLVSTRYQKIKFIRCSKIDQM